METTEKVLFAVLFVISLGATAVAFLALFSEDGTSPTATDPQNQITAANVVISEKVTAPLANLDKI
eukprot:COSAG01_NODE_64486_length_276_cov_0.836158_1_plen_65_part_10